MDLFLCRLILLGVAILAASAIPSPVTRKRDLPPSLMLQYNWPEPDPDITQFPHESSCNHYYLVLSEEDISVEKCPEDQSFDYFQHECIDQEHARCWSKHFGKYAHLVHHKIKKPFKCPYSWGKYPDVDNCTMYYVCLNGEAKHKKCASFEHFDKISRKCVAEIEGVCADQSDVVEHGYKCPHQWGSFVFRSDCSKYYECLEKKPTVRSCQQDMLFDKKKRKCVAKEEVRCGSRYNPYEPTFSPVEISSTSDVEKSAADLQTVEAVAENAKISDEFIEMSTLLPKVMSEMSPEISNTDAVTSKPVKVPEILKKTDVVIKVESKTEPLKETSETASESEPLSTEVSESTKNTGEATSKPEPKSKAVPEITKNTDKDASKSDSKSKVVAENPKNTDEIISESVTKEHKVDVVTTMGPASSKEPASESPVGKPLQATTNPYDQKKVSCPPGTCLTDSDGGVLTCPEADGLHPHPRNERRFLVCHNFQVGVSDCPGDLIFNDARKRCEWLLILRSSPENATYGLDIF